MKTLKGLAFLALCLIMAACGSGESAQKVAQRIGAGDKLTSQDYTVMIDYCGKYAEEVQKLQDKISLLPATSEEAGRLTGEIASLSDKYPYLSQFSDKLSNCTQEEIGSENVKKINEYSSYPLFYAPGWAGVEQASDVVGSIVEMPAEDTSGVIAGGAGEATE